MEVELAGFEAGDEQEVVDEPEQTVRIPVDDIEIATLVVGQVPVPERELEIAHDRSQGSTEIVRDERDELVLEAIGLE